jgi:hypothetical protein
MQILFPPMHVIPEEPVFHFEDATEKDSILEINVKEYNKHSHCPNFGIIKA